MTSKFVLPKQLSLKSYFFFLGLLIRTQMIGRILIFRHFICGREHGIFPYVIVIILTVIVNIKFVFF